MSDGTDPGILLIDAGRPPDATFTPGTVGGKAWGLLRMAAAGIRVPPGFVLGTACSRDYFANSNALPDALIDGLARYMRMLESITGKGFGSRRNPLLVSVRSGAPVSMPGMMETLLNIGLNDETVRGLIRTTGNPRLAWDSYRRLIRDYAEVVCGTDPGEFDAVLAARLGREGLQAVAELNGSGLRELCGEFKLVYRDCTDKEFPQDPWKQLHRAAGAVFDSWFSERAERYRALNHLDADLGTACLVQAMVFGNCGGDSGAGVGFTRNPANGADELYVDFLADSQGEDIVSGRHNVYGAAVLEQRFPAVFAGLQQIRLRLEKEFGDMQDFEFTVEQGELFLLQTRNGKRTPLAALRIAVEMFDAGLIDAAQALLQLQDIDTEVLYEHRFHRPPQELPLATGTPASTGVAAGRIALDEKAAQALRDAGTPVVLVRAGTSTEDIGAMSLADAIVTATGGRTSHAAVIARQLGTACVVGCRDLRVDLPARRVHIGDRILAEGECLSVDADNGRLYAGCLAIEKQRPEDLLRRVQEWQAAGTGRTGT